MNENSIMKISPKVIINNTVRKENEKMKKNEDERNSNSSFNYTWNNN